MAIAEHPTIFKRVPLQCIASYLAMKRETLSRYRRKNKVELQHERNKKGPVG